jgi:hypothetical protein
MAGRQPSSRNRVSRSVAGCVECVAVGVGVGVTVGVGVGSVGEAPNAVEPSATAMARLNSIDAPRRATRDDEMLIPASTSSSWANGAAAHSSPHYKPHPGQSRRDAPERWRYARLAEHSPTEWVGQASRAASWSSQRLQLGSSVEGQVTERRLNGARSSQWSSRWLVIFAGAGLSIAERPAGVERQRERNLRDSTDGRPAPP